MELKNFKKEYKKYYYFQIFSIVLSIIARLFNPGWGMILMVMLFILPVIYILIYIYSTNKMKKYFDVSITARVFFVICCISLVIFAILMPDEGDAPNSSAAIFSQVKNRNAINLLYKIAPLFAGINFVILIMGIIMERFVRIEEKIRKKRKMVVEK